MQLSFRRLSRTAVALAVGAAGAALAPTHGPTAQAATSTCTAPLRIAGDNPNTTGLEWGFHEGFYRELRSLLTNPANFGAAGTVPVSWVEGSPVGNDGSTPGVDPIPPGAFAGTDVYVSSARYLVNGGGVGVDQLDYRPAEKQRIVDFVMNGGGALLITNRSDFGNPNTAFGFTTGPFAFFEPVSTYPDFRSPADAQLTTGSPFQNGPFGQVSQAGMWHTVTAFTSVPNGWRLGGTVKLVNDPYSYVLDGVVLSYMPARGLGPNSGPVVVASDLDLFSNAYNAQPGQDVSPNANHSMTANNRTLTLNAFAWLGKQMCGLGRDTPGAAVGGGGVSGARTAAAVTDSRLARNRTEAPAIR